MVNFGLLSPEITVIICQPFMRQMGEICETCSIVGIRIRQWMAGTAERICAKFTPKTCLFLRWDDFECQDQKSNVKVTRGKNALCTHNTPTLWTKWNALVANIVTLAAGATTGWLLRGVFAGMRALGLAGYRWALPRICSSNCYDSYSIFRGSPCTMSIIG